MRGLGGVSKGGATAATRGAKPRPASGFPLGGAGANAAATGAAAASALAPVGLSLLAAQEGGDRSARDEAARRRAASILDELQGLQTELLGGRPDPTRLARLAALQTGDGGADPILRGIVDAVALRARIELVRRHPRVETERSKTVP